MAGTEPTSDRTRKREPRAVTYPYARITGVEPTPADGPDPYGNPDPEWLRIDWREHLRTVEAGGTPVNCVEIGEGPAIVFVHGLGGCWQNWLENLTAMAARGYRAIAFDLPGFGATPMPAMPISIPGYGELVGELCTELGTGACTLVGNSMGGFIAAEVAVGEPEWVERLVLVSSAGISHATMRRGPVLASARMSVAANPLLRRVDLTSMKRPGLRELAFGRVMRHPEQLRRELLVEFMTPSLGAPGFVPAVAALTGYDLLERLERIRVPTLIVWGRDDLVVPARDAAGFLERIPGAELVVFEDCGHAPMAERPTRFNRLLADFCARDADVSDS
ncbi:MAG TPA: alpha/beta hydrolase [Solirubrobacterales bacterium]|nr:alpha/beta hydrolase [Solirubrobacterales bacterium]